MADASLDDFFAKKDKSKKKSKVKSVENDDGSKSTKKEKKKDKPKMNSLNSSTNKSQERNKAVDDEWNDFEEEKAVDYSGLRIQNLQQKEDMEKDAEGEEEEFDENGEVRDKKDGISGPWNKSNAAAGPTVITEEEKPAPAPVVSGKYIPPSQRAAALGSSTSSGMPGRRGKKELPNIRSDVDFPTLAGMPGQEQQQQSIPPSQRSRGGLTLENKFAVLQD